MEHGENKIKFLDIDTTLEELDNVITNAYNQLK